MDGKRPPLKQEIDRERRRLLRRLQLRLELPMVVLAFVWLRCSSSRRSGDWVRR